MSKMITAVVMVDGRCRLMKLHELSTDVEFWILSATSFVGVGGGREALHMLDVWQVGCQWSRQERRGGAQCIRIGVMEDNFVFGHILHFGHPKKVQLG